ncbi:metallophosphoesterase [Kaistella yonginensis]|uniref:metallophosphoesterase n=1 Tax=Kaistella yonginensis TaxID=658267 RepID=UPI0025B4304A|nr:metallophosphoesterase [Kaistella yonginensis]MDN3606722.1 metallophosphoesterase [Kaistella yonginensis]
MIRIIHISDLHLESEKLSTEKENLIVALALDLKKFVNDETLLFFTGDLIDKGAVLFEDKPNAFKFFEENFLDIIISENPNLKGKIFLTPGNHDVFRYKIDEFGEIGIKSKLIDTQSLDNFVIENRVNSKHLERLEDYKKWESSFYSKYNTIDVSNFENSFILTIDNLKVGITCINSSWLCKDDADKESLLIGKNQIDNSLKQIRHCNVKLALCHHPIEFLKEFDKENLKLSLYKNYDALFTGHVHELSSLYTQDLLGNIFISIANSTIGDCPIERKFVNGYTILDLIPNKEITTQYRKYVEIHEKFVPNTDIGTEDGSKKFQILKDEKLIVFEEKQKIIQTIESRFVEKLNDDIIMSSSSTDVICSIDNLFVEPTILNNPQGTLSEEETITYSIDKILGSNENFIIFGVKESGKTLLLDKMFLESIKRFNYFKKFPVLLKFSDFKSNEILRIIREFLAISPKEIEEFLQNNEVYLFIDDINFNDKFSEKIENLKKLLIEFPKIQLITSCDLVLENVIPTEYLDHNDILNANIAFIQNFSSKEIKQLIQKWHHGKEIDLQDKMEKLIKSFVDFGLPKTPLSVTLFLWIFEKQEKKPINNSVLVELFIENLLEKTNIENIYSETFDFTNKKRLLSFVARFMYENGDEDYNYSIDYVELLKFFKEYLESRFPGQPQKVLGDFIKRGILNYQDENQIKFKSAFFFHYFLSLQFDYDSKFKKHVFTDDNYLSFINEITYYTGLKRDDEDILNFVQAKLVDAFGDINDDVRENHEKVDKVLESKKETSITFQIDEKKSNQKLTEKQLEDVFDNTLSKIPVSKTIEKKETNIQKDNIQIDKILKLACNVLKNSEDVDSFDSKKKAYKTTLLSSISFLMLYRDSLIMHYLKFQKQPENFPKNINFNLFIRVIPLIHQVVIYNWLGTQKLRPVIISKIEEDKKTVNISDFERFLSIYIYSDIRGADYPIIIEEYLKTTKFNYTKDLSFIKIMSYFHLRNNGKTLDDFYLKILANIRQELGYIDKSKKSSFMQKISDEKRKKK